MKMRDCPSECGTVDTYENCIVNMANRLKIYGAKKQRKLRGGYAIANGQGHSPEFGPGVGLLYCVACNTHVRIGHGRRHDVKRHIERAPGSDRERAAHIAKAQSRLGSINRFVAAGCEIDKVTSAEIAFAMPSTTCRWPLATSLGC